MVYSLNPAPSPQGVLRLVIYIFKINLLFFLNSSLGNPVAKKKPT